MTILIFVVAALAEIAGCFAFWAWLRLGAKPIWILPGVLSLVLFAVLLTRTEPLFAGRAYAAYGGIYIAVSLAWLWIFEGVTPSRYDLAGAALCIGGAAVILMGQRP